jgi:hypothetical protein
MHVALNVTDQRQSTDVAWYYPPASFRQYIIENWLHTGKLMFPPAEHISKDGLVRTIITTFRDEQAFAEYSQDPVRRREHLPMIAYNTSNNIIRLMNKCEPIMYFAITDVRPSTDVEFFYPAPELTEHIRENYIETGKYITAPIEKISKDKLRRTVLLQFRSGHTFDMFMADPVIQESIPIKEEYNQAHGITRNWDGGLGVIPASMIG